MKECAKHVDFLCPVEQSGAPHIPCWMPGSPWVTLLVFVLLWSWLVSRLAQFAFYYAVCHISIGILSQRNPQQTSEGIQKLVGFKLFCVFPLHAQFSQTGSSTFRNLANPGHYVWSTTVFGQGEVSKPCPSCLPKVSPLPLFVTWLIPDTTFGAQHFSFRDTFLHPDQGAYPK